MGSNVYFWLYKNPRFKDQFEEIKKIIEKEEKYEDFEFIIREKNNVGYVYAKYNFGNDDHVAQERVEFWGKIAEKYFKEEIILIDRSEGDFEEKSVLYFHHGYETERPESYKKNEINFVRKFSEISLKRYDKPFEIKVQEGE
ncbi:MAG: hypothetical protein HWN65_14595 [Candidatus Helarchaeota archaeon]|nr:hypothetical protein [Candidatus Helarchaeota archaeon]